MSSSFLFPENWLEFQTLKEEKLRLGQWTKMPRSQRGQDRKSRNVYHDQKSSMYYITDYRAHGLTKDRAEIEACFQMYTQKFSQEADCYRLAPVLRLKTPAHKAVLESNHTNYPDGRAELLVNFGLALSEIKGKTAQEIISDQTISETKRSIVAQEASFQLYSAALAFCDKDRHLWNIKIEDLEQEIPQNYVQFDFEYTGYLSPMACIKEYSMFRNPTEEKWDILDERFAQMEKNLEQNSHDITQEEKTALTRNIALGRQEIGCYRFAEVK